MPWKRILGQNTKRCRLVQRSPCRETTKESYCEVSFAVERSWQRLSCENTKNYVMSRSGEPQTIYSPRCSSVNLLTNTELYSLENTSPENTSSPKFFTNHHLQNTQCPSRTIQKILPLIRIQEANASFYFNPPNNSEFVVLAFRCLHPPTKHWHASTSRSVDQSVGSVNFSFPAIRKSLPTSKEGTLPRARSPRLGWKRGCSG